MAILNIKEIVLSFSVNIAGQFYVDSFLSRRNINVVPGLTVRLDEEAIRRDNPNYRININPDGNCISYTRVDGKNIPGSIVFTAYFDTPVHWPVLE